MGFPSSVTTALKDGAQTAGNVLPGATAAAGDTASIQAMMALSAQQAQQTEQMTIQEGKNGVTKELGNLFKSGAPQ